jgi:hypothetical protein
MAIGALILMGFALIVNLRIVSLGIIITAAALIIVSMKLGRNYFRTLKNAINLHRFDTDYLGTERVDEQLILKVASQALTSKSEDTLLFGLSLFRKMKLKQVPPSIIAALSSKFDTVKKSAIRVLENSGNESVVHSLMKQLALEKNPEICWHLVNGVLHFSPDFLISYAMNAISSDEPPIKAAAIAVFLETADKREIQEAESSLSMMINHPEARYRYWAANVLKTGALKNPTEYILKLLNDPDDKVVRNVLFAATLSQNNVITETLIQKLSNKRLSYSVGKTLVRMGPRVIPQLLKHVQQLHNLQEMRLEMILFAKFQAPEAEAALLDLLLTVEGELLDKCVISLAYRAKQFNLSKRAHRIIEQKALSEVEKIRVLQSYYEAYEDVDLRNEIHSRIFYARKRYLYLLASSAQPKIILQIIPTILSANHQSRAYINATELLELCVGRQVLKESISAALEFESSLFIPDGAVPMADDWLNKVFEFKKGRKQPDLEGELIEKVLLLRKVALFSFLSSEILQNIANIIHIKEIPKGGVIFKEGDPGVGLYILTSGRVNIVKNEMNIKLIMPGDFFGELALLDNAPRFAAAIVNEDAKLFFIEKNDFRQLTDELPEILKAVTKAIITYLRNQ